MNLKNLWYTISVLIFFTVLLAFLAGLWVVKITHNTLEYTEDLKVRIDQRADERIEQMIEQRL